MLLGALLQHPPSPPRPPGASILPSMVVPPVSDCTIWCRAGFTHTAFVFGYESQVHKSEIVGDSVPAGALITTFQKGLQYLELEANLAAEVRDHSIIGYCALDGSPAAALPCRPRHRLHDNAFGLWQTRCVSCILLRPPEL